MRAKAERQTAFLRTWTPWHPSSAVYHLWGGPDRAKCGRALVPLQLYLPVWVAATFARPCKGCA